MKLRPHLLVHNKFATIRDVLQYGHISSHSTTPGCYSAQHWPQRLATWIECTANDVPSGRDASIVQRCGAVYGSRYAGEGRLEADYNV